VEDAVAVAQEDPRAMELAAGVVEAQLCELFLVAVVVFDGGDRLVERDVEVVVEVAAARWSTRPEQLGQPSSQVGSNMK
jgi:hypothetical protein